MRFIALWSTLLFLASGAASAGSDFTEVNLRPLLRVHLIGAYPESGTPPLPPQQEDSDVLITYGGALTSSTTQRFEGEDFTLILLRGVGSPSDRLFLARTLSEGRIGGQIDCQIQRDFGFQGREEIIWYGRNGRQQRFAVVYSSTSAPGLSLCSPAVERIAAAIGSFTVSVALDPSSEIFSFP